MCRFHNLLLQWRGGSHHNKYSASVTARMPQGRLLHTGNCASIIVIVPLIARFMWPTWGPPGADRTQVGPRWVTWKVLSGTCSQCEFRVSMIKQLPHKLHVSCNYKIYYKSPPHIIVQLRRAGLVHHVCAAPITFWYKVYNQRFGVCM